MTQLAIMFLTSLHRPHPLCMLSAHSSLTSHRFAYRIEKTDLYYKALEYMQSLNERNQNGKHFKIKELIYQSVSLFTF